MQFIFPKIPDTVEEFKNMPNFSLKNPHSTTALLILALCKYADNKQVGIDMINVLKGPVPLSNYDIQFIRDRFMDGKSYIPFSYFDGSSPANNYTPTMPLTLNTYDDNLKVEEGYERVFLSSSGADSKRYITLRKKGDEFFLWEYAGVLSGIRIPVKDDPWS